LGAEPVSDIDPAVVDSLNVLDPIQPIRKADITTIWGLDPKDGEVPV